MAAEYPGAYEGPDRPLARKLLATGIRLSAR